MRSGLSRKQTIWIGVVALFLAIALGSLGNSTNTAAAPAPSALATVPTSTAPVAPAAPVAAPGGGQYVTVARVIDGDTFELADGSKVRVLGIDSCEMSTQGGKDAKAFAEEVFADPMNQPVTLQQEPGVDKDQYGRLLRYVKLGGYGYDYGEQIVVQIHTGVYAGKNDANAGYVAKLRSLDSDGRNCSGQAPAPVANSTGNTNIYVHHDDDDHHKSRFCRRHWFC